MRASRDGGARELTQKPARPASCRRCPACPALPCPPCPARPALPCLSCPVSICLSVCLSPSLQQIHQPHPSALVLLPIAAVDSAHAGVAAHCRHRPDCRRQAPSSTSTPWPTPSSIRPLIQPHPSIIHTHTPTPTHTHPLSCTHSHTHTTHTHVAQYPASQPARPVPTLGSLAAVDFVSCPFAHMFRLARNGACGVRRPPSPAPS